MDVCFCEALVLSQDPLVTKTGVSQGGQEGSKARNGAVLT